MKISPTIEGLLILQKPTIRYDSIMLDNNNNTPIQVLFMQKGVVVAKVSTGCIYLKEGDTFTIANLKGLIEVDI